MPVALASGISESAAGSVADTLPSRTGSRCTFPRKPRVIPLALRRAFVFYGEHRPPAR